MNINYQIIGQRIARRRHELGLKQTEVCELCSLNEKYLSNIERAKSIPSIDVFLRICYALETTPDALLLGTNTSSDKALQADVISKIKVLNTDQLSLTDSFLQWLIQKT